MGKCSSKPLVLDSSPGKSNHTAVTGNSVHRFKDGHTVGALPPEPEAAPDSYRIAAPDTRAPEALSSPIGKAAARHAGPKKPGARPISELSTILPGAAPASPQLSAIGLGPDKSLAPAQSLEFDAACGSATSDTAPPIVLATPPASLLMARGTTDEGAPDTSPRNATGLSFTDEAGMARKRGTTVTFVDPTAEGPARAGEAAHRADPRRRSRLQQSASGTDTVQPSERNSPERTSPEDGDAPAAPPLPTHKSTPNPLPAPGPLQLPAAKGGSCEPGLWVLRRTGSVRSKYLMADSLGRGQFGAVCVAMERSTGQRWACKSVSKRRVQGMHDFSMADVLREVEVLYTIGGHPGVVGLREVYEDDEELHLVMDLCQGGDWFERLINYGRYTEAEAAATIRAVLEALAYCHSLGVMHRDIKPENIMFVDRTDQSAVKLTDFGLAAMFTEGVPLTEVLGSAYYVAPEVLREKYGKEADIWSTGVVLFIALGGYAPFDGANEREVFTKILHEPLVFKDPSWAHISSDAKHIISRMLTKDPKQRAAIKELLAHPWFSTCAGSLTPSLFVSTPAGSMTLPTNAAQTLAASLKMPSISTSPLQVDLSFTRRLPRGSIAKALARAFKRGKAITTVPDAVIARLQQFTAMNAFKRQARRVLATYLPEEEVVGLMQVFKTMDKDGDGVLTALELQEALAARGVHISDANAKVMLQRTDADGDGAIDYVEFLAATLHLARLERDERLYKAFRHFDPDGTGFITREGLEAGLSHIGKVNVDRILQEVDIDGDGRICYAEFCDMLRHDGEPGMALLTGNGEDGGTWGAWTEGTDSGRMVLTVPRDSSSLSRHVSVDPSREASRQTSVNERASYTSLGAVSIRRSLGGNLLMGSRITRASRTSGVDRGSAMGRPSISSSSRFGSMRAAAYLATRGTESSERSSVGTVGSGGEPQRHGGVQELAGAPGCMQVVHSGNVQRLNEKLEVVREGSTTSDVSSPARTATSQQRGVDLSLSPERPCGAASHNPASPFARPQPQRGVTTPTAWPDNAQGTQPRGARRNLQQALVLGVETPQQDREL